MPCYMCNGCNRCGKFTEGSPAYQEAPSLPCPKCGGEVDMLSGICKACKASIFSPPGTGGDEGSSFKPHAC